MGTTMKFSLLIVAVAVVAAVNSFDADAVVPEADIVVPQSALLQDEAFEAYKAHVVTAMDALHTRAQLAMQAKAIATAEREEAQWETAKLMAHNDALMNDMGDNFPALMEVDATKANLQKKADKQVKKEDEKATDDAKEGSKSAPPAEHHASGVHPEHHEDDDAEEDYGNCVTPPEFSAYKNNDWDSLFGKKKSEEKPEGHEGKVSVGAIRTMCASEIHEKGDSERDTKHTLEKTRKTEVKAKEDSNKADVKGAELKEKAEDAEHSQKVAVKEAATKNKSTRESVGKTGHEATQKTKATAETGAKEVTSKDHYNKIVNVHHKHHAVQKTVHRAEKRVTIVQGGRDNAVEIQGKHEWQHQELVDKSGVEKVEKHQGDQIQKLTKLIKDSHGGSTTIVKGGSQKSSETKTKVRTNEVLIKGGEKLGKKHKGSKHTIVIKPTHSAVAAPDHEMSKKLIKVNKELTAKLAEVNKQKKGTNDESVVKVLKAQVRELEAKKTPKRHDVIRTKIIRPRKHHKRRPRTVTKTIMYKPKNCHKETQAKHPFASLERNVKAIMKQKVNVKEGKAKCKSKAHAEVRAAQKEAEAKVNKAQRQLV